MTARGEEVLSQAREPVVKQMMEIMSCLSEEEVQSMTRLMEKIRDRTFNYRNIKGEIREISPTIANEREFPWPVEKG